jgi:hypothetical protein
VYPEKPNRITVT